MKAALPDALEKRFVKDFIDGIRLLAEQKPSPVRCRHCRLSTFPGELWDYNDCTFCVGTGTEVIPWSELT